MPIIATSVFWICGSLIVFAYALYPIAIWALSRWFAADVIFPDHPEGELPLVSLLIVAHNEEEVIEERIRNALAIDYPSDRLEIVIALDGCTDGTSAIVQQYQSHGVRLLEFPQRSWKVDRPQPCLREFEW